MTDFSFLYDYIAHFPRRRFNKTRLFLFYDLVMLSIRIKRANKLYICNRCYLFVLMGSWCIVNVFLSEAGK